MKLVNSDFTISDTSFIGGYSHKGGALNIQISKELTSSTVIKNSNFLSNRAKVSGGAIYISGCGISFIECTFSKNNVDEGGSGNDIF